MCLPMYYEVASYFGGIMIRQVGILLALIAISVTAAASIRAFTGGTGGGCCGSCCRQSEAETAPAE